jgi:poly(A) polymerase
MEVVDRLPAQPWMREAATRDVLAALTAEGDPARFVGGCVRDALLGRPVADIDIATPAPPDRVLALLARAGIRALPTGIAHGTVTALADRRHFEITTLRHDVSTDGRRAVVAFTADWAADAARRDFTINALFCDADGRVYDHVGGLADLRARHVRFVGDARTRIREDVLRLLRFFRFYAQLGAPPPDAAALAAAGELAPLLPQLSGERVRAELLRLLASPDPAAVLRLMQAHGVLAHLLPPGLDLDRLAGLVAVEARLPPSLGAAVDPLRRLAALLHDGGAAAALGDRLRLSNQERARLAAMVAAPPLDPALDLRARHRLLYRLGTAPFADAVLLAWAAAGGEAAGWLGLLELAATWPPPTLPVSGRDVAACGVARGPRVGLLLRALESWWIEGDFVADRSACLARLRELAAAGAGPPGVTHSP